MTRRAEHGGQETTVDIEGRPISIAAGSAVRLETMGFGARVQRLWVETADGPRTAICA